MDARLVKKQEVEATDRLLTPAQAGQVVNLSPATLARRRMLGGGPPFIKFGSSRQASIRYRKSDLDKWVEQSLRTSTSDDGEAKRNSRAEDRR
jgi:hypothetical protein